MAGGGGAEDFEAGGAGVSGLNGGFVVGRFVDLDISLSASF